MSDAALASPLIALCYGVAGVLFVLALVTMAMAPRLLAGRMAMAGLLLAFLTTLCTLDALNLPEMIGTTLCGAGLGWLIARRRADDGLVSLAVGFQGLIGLALLFLGSAIALDPDSLGIVPGVIGQVETILCAGLGALGAIIAGFALLKGIAPLAPLSFCSGAGAMAAGLLLANWAMVMAGVLVIMPALIVMMRPAAGRGLPIVHPIP